MPWFADGYVTPDYINQIDDFGKIVIALASTIGLIWTISRIAIFMDRRRNDKFATRVFELMDPKLDALYDFVAERTNPIQPGENGGESLADIHKRLDPIEAKLGLKERRHPSGETYLEMEQDREDRKNE